MALNDYYPEPAILVKRELAVLDFMRNQPYIKERHPQFALDAEKYFERNRSIIGGFEFFSWLDVLHSEKRTTRPMRPNTRLAVGARIERQGNAYGNVTYCLAVCSTRSLAVWRKFHFDVLASTEPMQRRQPHPRFHIQYCGEFVPDMERMGVRRNQLKPLHPELSEPRILTWPMSLALIIDMALHEFPDQKSTKFRSTPEWRGIIRVHETTFLRPFFERCLQLIKSRDRSTPTMADALYIA